MKRTTGVLAGIITAALLSQLALDQARSQNDAAAAARAGVREIGKRMGGDVVSQSAQLYAAAHRESEPGGTRLISDIAYGSDALQVLDVVVPEQAPTTPAPVVVYVHGGGLTGGNKVTSGTDGLIYSNVPRYFARHGMIGVNANYRLVPNVKWPGGPEDIRGVLSWIRENIAEYGGDPNRIFLMGQSAGGTHVSAYLFHEASHFDDGPGVIGALLSSAGFGPSAPDTMRAYVGDDEAAWQANSPLGLVDSYTGSLVPIFLWSAELDPTRIETRVAQMYAKLCMKYEDCPRFTQFQGHNHVSQVMSIGSADSAVGEAALDFIRDVLEGSATGGRMSAL
jgi:acetyl esterase/lipase